MPKTFPACANCGSTEAVCDCPNARIYRPRVYFTAWSWLALKDIWAWRFRHSHFGRYAHKPDWFYVGPMGPPLDDPHGPPANYDRKCLTCGMED